ncbi:MAG: sugar ABC transporter permease, partial [Clostridia bacterium]
QLSSFVKSFQNIAFFVITIVPLQLMFSLAFAMLLTKLTQKISAAIRTIIYIPVLLSGIVASIIFLLLLNFGGGLITSILYSLNLDAISFATDPFWARVIVIIPTLWLGFGYNTLVLYAGLMNVPKTYYEAASIDGAGAWTKLFKITLPQMKVYFVLLIINLVTTTLQMYEIPMMMTEGGPLESTLTPVLFLMANHNGDRPTNVVIAGALIVMLIIMLINTFVFKSMKSNKSEDS